MICCPTPPTTSIRRRDIGETLLNIALTHARPDCDKETVGTFRAILSDCRQGNPRYGRLLWEEGPARTHALMERLLDASG